ncbi:hypothetical protein ACHAXN_013170 [Cyclotella atomus]
MKSRKLIKIWASAGELGYTQAYRDIANLYLAGRGVKKDSKKAKHYYELAAMGGCAYSRCFLGWFEGNEGDLVRAVKHHLIAAEGGEIGSVNVIAKYYRNGQTTKEKYERALRLYQQFLDEVISDQREEAAAYNRHGRSRNAV